jgi:hypothetical protein
MSWRNCSGRRCLAQRSSTPRSSWRGVPPEFTALLTYLFSEVLGGRNAHLTDGVRCALGREPKDFSDYARDTAATGV